jgi:hypothetical protein
MLTIIDSVKPDSWAEIKVKCDCGNELKINYYDAHRHMYSCGCKRRIRRDAADHTGLRVYKASGNRGAGREIEVVGRDEKTQMWQYLCACCAQIYTLPRGFGYGIVRALEGIAAQVCPNYHEFFPARRWCWPLAKYAPEVKKLRLGEPYYYDWLAQFYDEQYVKRNPKGEIVGFYGVPQRPIVQPPHEWQSQEAARRQSTTLREQALSDIAQADAEFAVDFRED